MAKTNFTHTNTPVFFSRAVLGLFMFMLALALYLGAAQGRPYLNTLIAGAVLAAALMIAARRLPVWETRLGAAQLWLMLTLLCLAVKAGYILVVRLEPWGDYATFWGYATSLASREVIFGGRYLALFPHIFGYSAFLSWMIRIFGAHPLLAPILNVLLTVCAGSFLFLLCHRLIGRRGAVLAYLLWIICPSQTMYNSMILSEPLYTAGILAFLVLVTAFFHRLSSQKPAAGTLSLPIPLALVLGGTAGVLLAAVNATRPVGIILLLALFLWVAFLNTNLIAERAARMGCLLFLLALCAVYLAAGQLMSHHIAHRIGEEPAGFPGYNLLVGFNEESGGRWNKTDSDSLDAANTLDTPASEVQDEMRAQALDRIFSGDMDFLALFQNKYRTFLGTDDACVGYSASAIQHTVRFSYLCNGFYYLCLLLALAGAVRLWKDRNRGPLLLAAIYFLGLTLAQMLVEVAGRYHYSLIPVLVMLAAYGLEPANS